MNMRIPGTMEDLFGFPINMVDPGFLRTLPAALHTPAPLSTTTRKRLMEDARNVAATAERKGLCLDRWEVRDETLAARQHFELGCWIFHLNRLFAHNGVVGFHARIECNYRLFMAGIYSPGYMFHTVFDFGERQFDGIMEMGDGAQIVEALRHLLLSDRSGNLLGAFEYHGWNKTTGTGLRA